MEGPETVVRARRVISLPDTAEAEREGRQQESVGDEGVDRPEVERSEDDRRQAEVLPELDDLLRHLRGGHDVEDDLPAVEVVRRVTDGVERRGNGGRVDGEEDDPRQLADCTAPRADKTVRSARRPADDKVAVSGGRTDVLVAGHAEPLRVEVGRKLAAKARAVLVLAVVLDVVDVVVLIVALDPLALPERRDDVLGLSQSKRISARPERSDEATTRAQHRTSVELRNWRQPWSIADSRAEIGALSAQRGSQRAVPVEKHAGSARTRGRRRAPGAGSATT